MKNKKLLETDAKIEELMARYKRININDTARWSNQGASFTRQLANMFELARVITMAHITVMRVVGRITNLNSQIVMMQILKKIRWRN